MAVVSLYSLNYAIPIMRCRTRLMSQIKGEFVACRNKVFLTVVGTARRDCELRDRHGFLVDSEDQADNIGFGKRGRGIGSGNWALLQSKDRMT